MIPQANSVIVRRALPCAIIFLLCGLLTPVSSAVAQFPGDASASDEVLPFFGIGGDAHTGRNLIPWMPKMAAIGIHAMRCCNNVDQMRYLDALQIKYGGLLYGVPPGDKLDAPGTLPVKDIDSWTAYVTNQVKMAKGRVKYWEIWNEPPNGTGRSQTPADYAKIVVAAYNAARAVDPACKIGLAAKSVHVNYLEQVILAGAKDHFDFIVLHPYEVLGGVGDNLGTEPIYMHIVPTVRKMLAAQDPAKVNVPVIFTEIGSDASKGLDHQAHALVKAYTMGLAQGVAWIEWFEGMDGDSGPMGLLDSKCKPRPAYKALAQLIQHLGQHPTYLGWVMLKGADYGFLFQGATGTVLITWAPKGPPDHVNFGTAMQFVDPMTGNSSSDTFYDLTTAPVMILNVPPAFVAKAQADKALPLPWGGDYSNAKSVSVTMGAVNVEKGLHTQAGANVAKDVLAYGGSARAGSVPGGNVFMVDPSFLCYTPTPIEITVVVRRNEANDNAGFDLVYESTNGFKNCGWYIVPDNKEWHTMTWTINDDEFVNMWDYNFSLDSHGGQLNRYDIKSVTVTKLN